MLGLALAAGAAGAASHHADFEPDPARPRAGEPATLRFTVHDSLGNAVRFLQFVHERPLHLIVVSQDLATFDHIHPELALGDTYEVQHVFPHGGSYRLFADYTPPGAGTIVDRFDLDVAGPPRAAVRLVADKKLVRATGGVRVTVTPDRPLRAREDVILAASLADAATGRPVSDLQLYLGSLAHFILVSEDKEQFIHAHPLETGEVIDPSRDPNTAHVHDPALLAKTLVGPSPSTIRAQTSFPRAGLYKLWVQFQRAGQVVTVPFVVRVGEAAPVAARGPADVPAGAVRISVSAAGYAPARIDLRKGVPAVLAFSRPSAGNCGGTVVIPGLGIRRDLPVGETVLIPITPEASGELPFTCGMGMYQGLIVVRE